METPTAKKQEHVCWWRRFFNSRFGALSLLYVFKAALPVWPLIGQSQLEIPYNHMSYYEGMRVGSSKVINPKPRKASVCLSYLRSMALTLPYLNALQKSIYKRACMHQRREEVQVSRPIHAHGCIVSAPVPMHPSMTHMADTFDHSTPTPTRPPNIPIVLQ